MSRMKSRMNMDDQGFIAKPPSEITSNIFSRLPVKSIARCKCVCKEWLHLLSTPEFANSYASTPGVIVLEGNRRGADFCEIHEFEDETEIDKHERHYKPVVKFYIDNSISLVGSVNGLLLLRKIPPNIDLFVCNPITRECIICQPRSGHWYPSVATYGFGVSSVSGQYKIVRIFHDCELEPETNAYLGFPKPDCQVYELGTGTWRNIAPDASYGYNCRTNGLFMNGNLHWLVTSLKRETSISCLDLETEKFRHFASPPASSDGSPFYGSLALLEGCLCACDNYDKDNKIVIWIMKVYGVDKSWSKRFSFSKIPDNISDDPYEYVHPINIFKDGDVLMKWGDFHLFYYSNKNRKITRSGEFFEQADTCLIDATPHVSSFISLGTLCGHTDQFFDLIPVIFGL